MLDQRFFQGDDRIPPDIVNKLYVDSPTRILPTVANRLGWDGQLAGAVILQLAEDGTTIRRGFFSLMGQLAEEPIVLPATKIWAGAKRDTTVTITLPPAEAFSFLDGTLASDYMDESEIQFVVARGHTPVLPTHYRRNNIAGLSLRMLVHLARGSNGNGGLAVKLTLLAFPRDTEELRDQSDATQSAGWAGIKIYEAESPLFPAAPLGQWGNPIYPLLYRHSTRVACEASNQELRSAIAALMRTACAPTACTSTAALQKFWDNAAADPASVQTRAPTVTWPHEERPARTAGTVGSDLTCNSLAKKKHAHQNSRNRNLMLGKRKEGEN